MTRRGGTSEGYKPALGPGLRSQFCQELREIEAEAEKGMAVMKGTRTQGAKLP